MLTGAWNLETQLFCVMMAATVLPFFNGCHGMKRKSIPKIKGKTKINKYKVRFSVHSCMGSILSDIFWLRFLENGTHRHHDLPSPPRHYEGAAGLSCIELLMADAKALKIYFQYFHAFMSTPLPENYDPEVVGRYFLLRPHVLMVRIFQLILSFVAAVIKLEVLRSVQLSDLSKNAADPNSSGYHVGQVLKESFLNLGPTFIKVGQSLATRPDIISTEIAEALAELHDNVPPFPKEIAMKIIEDDLLCRPDEVFTYISDAPCAAASFGQVYRGCALDGTLVAIKVQRPDLLHLVVRDIYILRLGLSLLRKIAKRKSNLALYADELGKGFIGELDYKNEAENASNFLDAHSEYTFIRVPRVFKQLTGRRVLTMEWLEGENPKTLLSLSRGISGEESRCSRMEMANAKSQLLDLVNKGVEASLVQLLDTGLLHADPHPGNLRYTPDGCIGFLDFGLLCSIEKKHQLAILGSILHIANGDWKGLVYDLSTMDVISPGTNIRNLTMDFEERLNDEISKDGLQEIKFSKVLASILSLGLKYQFRMPPYYTLVLRSLASLEGLAVAADENFKTFQAAYPFVVRKLLRDNSHSNRVILYSIIFNNRKELQWTNISRFLQIGFTSIRGNGKSYGNGLGRCDDALQIANLFVRLLLSSDGRVVRRLLFSVNWRSFAREMISKDAAFYRQVLITVLADAFCQWMLKLDAAKIEGNCSDHLKMSGRNDSVPTSYLVYAALADRRLKIIFFKALRETRNDLILLLRVSFSLCRVLAISMLLGFHRYLVLLSDRLFASFSHSSPKSRLVPVA